MGVTRKIDSTSGICKMTASGTIQLIDLRLAYEALLVDPAFFPGINILWDLTGADTVVPDADDLEKLADWFEITVPLRGNDYRTAFVTREKHEYGLIMMFATYLEDAMVSFELFTDIEEALVWIENG